MEEGKVRSKPTLMCWSNVKRLLGIVTEPRSPPKNKETTGVAVPKHTRSHSNRASAAKGLKKNKKIVLLGDFLTAHSFSDKSCVCRGLRELENCVFGLRVESDIGWPVCCSMSITIATHACCQAITMQVFVVFFNGPQKGTCLHH